MRKLWFLLTVILVVKNVKGQKISCSWERHQNKKLIGKQIGTSSKREHAKSKCKAQQDKCTGIIEYGPNDFALMEHRSFVYMNDVDSWVKRCEPCSSMEIDLTESDIRSPEPSFWRTKHSIGLTSILSICLWFQGDHKSSLSVVTLRKARMLSLTGDRNLTLDTMRDVNDKFVGFDVNINDYSAGIIFDEALDDLKWNLLCLSIDGNNYLRFNLNGETLLAQKIQNSSRKYFSEVSTITFGSELGNGFRGKIFDINIYGSSMKEREVKSIYAAKEEKCACERGELFWLAKSTADAEMQNVVIRNSLGFWESCPNEPKTFLIETTIFYTTTTSFTTTTSTTTTTTITLPTTTTTTTTTTSIITTTTIPTTTTATSIVTTITTTIASSTSAITTETPSRSMGNQFPDILSELESSSTIAPLPPTSSHLTVLELLEILNVPPETQITTISPSITTPMTSMPTEATTQEVTEDPNDLEFQNFVKHLLGFKEKARETSTTSSPTSPPRQKSSPTQKPLKPRKPVKTPFPRKKLKTTQATTSSTTKLIATTALTSTTSPAAVNDDDVTGIKVSDYGVTELVDNDFALDYNDNSDRIADDPIRSEGSVNDGGIISTIVLAALFAFAICAAGLYVYTDQKRKRRRQNEIKDLKYDQFEVQIRQPRNPKIVTSSDIYMNYY